MIPTKLPPNIYRHNAAGFEGFRVVFRRDGQLSQKYFSAKHHGSLTKAYRAACAYADEQRKIPGRERRFLHVGKSRARSGIRGVMKVNESWCASWYDPPQKRRRVYTGTGSDGLKLAKRIRKEAERLILEGRPTEELLTKYK